MAVRNFTGATSMRDLTVANVHTYYVIADGHSVLVHNNNGSECGARALLDRAKELKPFQGTTAVVRVRSKTMSDDGTFEEQIWIASSKRYWPTAWKKPGVLRPGEHFKERMRSENTHAEEDIMDHRVCFWTSISIWTR